MNIPDLHPWNVPPEEAVRIQNGLRKKLRLSPPRKAIKTIAAADVAYSPQDEEMHAALLLYAYPDLALLENATAWGRSSFPYVPGLLSFREAPILLKAFSALKRKPDLLLFDGQGTAHPRSMGIAAHLGILLNLSSIGCAKTRLFGRESETAPHRGSCTPLLDGGRAVGMTVRTRSGVKPVYVSPGHRMNLEASVKLVLSLCRGHRIPEPLREAHIFAGRLRSGKTTVLASKRVSL